MSYRLRDVFVATLGLIMLAPLMLLISVLLLISQRRVFFIQLRPGLNGHPFRLIKFSTLYDVPPGQDEYFRQQDRLTPVGKILRQYSLDELPQLFNVLKGDMSLVGPRPLLMDYLDLYTQEEHRRHHVRPGITGWAQVNGRNQLSFKQRFAYDLWYLNHRSHFLDIKILGLTFLKVFRQEGVYANTWTTMEKFNGNN